jgi:hypothetical protein
VLYEEIRSGNISLGEAINPRTYVKYTVIDGNITTSEFIVEGRKHKLYTIRQKLLEQHKKFMRLHSDSYFENMPIEQVKHRINKLDIAWEIYTEREMRDILQQQERTRYFQLWHDASSIANHSHILFSINVIYDPATFYTNIEYYQLCGERLNIQSIIETPELYIIGRYVKTCYTRSSSSTT